MARPSQLDPRERKIVLMLKEERKRQQISANQLSKNVRISRTTITNLDADEARPTLWVLLKMADGLNVSLSKLLKEAGA